MVRNGQVLKHRQENKQTTNQKKTQSPDKESGFKRFMDKAIYFVGVSAPLMTIPQMIKVYSEKNAEGLSLLTWSSYILISVMWIIYGIQHKEKPIIITNTAWFVIDVAIVVGIVVFG